MKFLTHATVEHFLIGLKILNQLVVEMNQANPGMSLTQYRKTACSFRDLTLFQIFQIPFTSLQQLQIDTADERLRERAITLSVKCLSFDFVGTSLNESSEDMGTIQIPSSWRPVLEDTSTMQLFFDYHACTKPPLSNVALECLVRLASVRRSLFSTKVERSKFLSHLMSRTREFCARNTVCQSTRIIMSIADFLAD
jgi:exportin-7